MKPTDLGIEYHSFVNKSHDCVELDTKDTGFT